MRIKKVVTDGKRKQKGFDSVQGRLVASRFRQCFASLRNKSRTGGEDVKTWQRAGERAGSPLLISFEPGCTYFVREARFLIRYTTRVDPTTHIVSPQSTS